MKTAQQNPVYTLSHLRETAHRSYSWISQSPERRGDNDIKAYSEELDSDIKAITEMGADAAGIDRYKKQYEDKFRGWLSSQGNTASSFVTGPANFPVARQEKLRRWAENKYKAFREWRDKVLAAYRRHEKKDKVEKAGGWLEIYRAELAALEATQERYKNINVAYRAYKKNPQSLQDSGLPEADQKMIIQWVPEYDFEKCPIHPYQMSNNLANIKRLKGRVAELEAKEERKEGGNKEFAFAGGLVVFNYEQDRLQIKHDVKPAQEVIDKLKRNGFRWSPFNKAWQRQLTDNAKYATQQLLGINFLTLQNKAA